MFKISSEFLGMILEAKNSHDLNIISSWRSIYFFHFFCEIEYNKAHFSNAHLELLKVGEAEVACWTLLQWAVSIGSRCNHCLFLCLMGFGNFRQYVTPLTISVISNGPQYFGFGLCDPAAFSSDKFCVDSQKFSPTLKIHGLLFFYMPNYGFIGCSELFSGFP